VRSGAERTGITVSNIFIGPALSPPDAAHHLPLLAIGSGVF
jgi:hypothetical protein